MNDIQQFKGILCKHGNPALKLCVFAGCSDSAYMCSNQQCQKLHEHDGSYKAIKCDSVNQQLKQFFVPRVIVHEITKSYEDIKSQLRSLIKEQIKKALKWLGNEEDSYPQSVKSFCQTKQLTGSEASTLWQDVKTGPKHNGKTNQSQRIQKLFCQFMNKCKISFLNEVVSSESEQEEVEPFPQQSPSKIRIQHQFETMLKQVQADYSLISQLKCKDVSQFLQRAKIHEKQRNFPLAQKDITSALQLDNRSLGALLRRAILYTSMKEYQKAQKDYANYLSMDKNNAFAYQNYGVILQHLGKQQQALFNFSRSLQLEPYSQTSLLSRGKHHLSQKNYEGALKDFSRFIDSNKQNSIVYTYRAKCWIYLDNNQNALEDLNTALSLDPHNMMALIERSGIYHSKKAYDEAFKDYQSASLVNPSMASLYYNMASILISKQKSEEAEVQLKKSLNIDPHHELSLLTLTNLLLKEQRYKQAIQYLNKAGDRFSNNINLIYNKAFGYKSLKDIDNAIIWYSKGLQLDADNVKCLLGRASCLLLNKSYDCCYSDFVNAYKLDRNNLDIVYNIGVVLVQKNQLEAATAIFSQLLSINPDHLLALKQRAKLFYKLNREEEFQKDCKHIQKLAAS